MAKDGVRFSLDASSGETAFDLPVIEELSDEDPLEERSDDVARPNSRSLLENERPRLSTSSSSSSSSSSSPSSARSQSPASESFLGDHSRISSSRLSTRPQTARSSSTVPEEAQTQVEAPDSPLNSQDNSESTGFASQPESSESAASECSSMNKRNFEEEIQDCEDIEKLLHRAARKGDCDLLEYIFDNWLQIRDNVVQREESRNQDLKVATVTDLLNNLYFGETLLTTAIKRQNENVAKLLILRGTNIHRLCSTYEYRVEHVQVKKLVLRPRISLGNLCGSPRNAVPTYQVVRCSKECVDRYDLTYKHLAYIHGLYEIFDMLEALGGDEL